MSSNILIGTSGYDYPEWKGIFYPDNLKRKDFLSYYATQFNALEVNNTFYNMPTAERLLSFWERSEGRIQFSVKANRLLTHEAGAGWQQDASLFINAVSPLAEKSCLCTILFQFPQSFHYTTENRLYLAKLIEVFGSLPVVIEFRHEEWIRASVLEGLESRGAGLCFCDMPDLKYLPKFGQTSPTTSIFYLRLHGRNANAWYATENSPNGNARYTYDYTDQELNQFVPVIQNAVLTGKKPVVFFNNHPNGSGAKNAVRLKELLENR